VGERILKVTRPSSRTSTHVRKNEDSHTMKYDHEIVEANASDDREDHCNTIHENARGLNETSRSNRH
jgi:hypothetical protein